VETNQLEFEGLRRAARLAACSAGAVGEAIDAIADEAMTRLLMQDGPVNNPKAWVRRTARRLAVEDAPSAKEPRGARRIPQQRRRIQPDDLLEGLDEGERLVVVAHRAGYTNREIGRRYGLTEDAVRALLADANRKLRRSSRRLEQSAG
jgi:DNA-directed RNA polymerase specialized sigma24 family protein